MVIGVMFTNLAIVWGPHIVRGWVITYEITIWLGEYRKHNYILQLWLRVARVPGFQLSRCGLNGFISIDPNLEFIEITMTTKPLGWSVDIWGLNEWPPHFRIAVFLH